jgi:hypothetical protein
MNNNELNSLIQSFINKNGLKGEQVSDTKNKQKVEKLMKGLDEKQAKQLKKIINDPKKTQDILKSSAAQALIKKLSGNG